MVASVSQTIHDISQDSWNALVSENNPFIRHEFFASLEDSFSVGEKTGWYPLYFTYHEDNELKAASFAYIKTDSYGEFIFDWDWARAYQSYGIPYYPKLTSAIPYSPISAPKLLGDKQLIKEKLLPFIMDYYKTHNLSGLHFLFTREEEAPLYQWEDLKERYSFQYHWEREQETSFEDFLQTLKKNRRKSIKRERREVKEQQLDIQWLLGQEIQEEDLDFFYDCYLGTIDKKWSQAYLTKDFFNLLIKRLPSACLLIMAKEESKPIACAFYLKSETTLFGRYWGCQRELPFLHFELCLYQGLDYVFHHKLERFEAGAQGEHKRMRGFQPILTKSYHHLKHPQFFNAVKDFLDKEKTVINDLFQHFEEESPRKTKD